MQASMSQAGGVGLEVGTRGFTVTSGMNPHRPRKPEVGQCRVDDVRDGEESRNMGPASGTLPSPEGPSGEKHVVTCVPCLFTRR